MAERLSLSRSQLASFLKDFEQIKQFEKLFGMTNASIDTIEQLTVLAAGAQSTANAALAELSRIADALELLALAPKHQPIPEPEVTIMRRGALTANELADVDTANPQDADALVFSNGKWRNGAVTQVDIGTVETIEVGAADSGGIGYRLLRVAN